MPHPIMYYPWKHYYQIKCSVDTFIQPENLPRRGRSRWRGWRGRGRGEGAAGVRGQPEPVLRRPQERGLQPPLDPLLRLSLVS